MQTYPFILVLLFGIISHCKPTMDFKVKQIKKKIKRTEIKGALLTLQNLRVAKLSVQETSRGISQYLMFAIERDLIAFFCEHRNRIVHIQFTVEPNYILLLSQFTVDPIKFIIYC